MRRTFIICAVALLVFVRPVQAQRASPETMPAAKDLIQAMRAADQLKVLMPMLMQQLKPAIVQGRPEVERDYEALLPQMLTLTDERMIEFTAGMAAIYANYFTVEEIRQLSEFYRRPVGQKMLQVLPKIAQDGMALGQKLGQAMALDARNRMIEELRRKGHKI